MGKITCNIQGKIYELELGDFKNNKIDTLYKNEISELLENKQENFFKKLNENTEKNSTEITLEKAYHEIIKAVFNLEIENLNILKQYFLKYTLLREISKEEINLLDELDFLEELVSELNARYIQKPKPLIQTLSRLKEYACTYVREHKNKFLHYFYTYS